MNFSGTANLMMREIDMEKRPFHIKENLAESLMRQIVANEERIEAGYPPEKVTGCFTLTKPIIDTAEETIDWL